MHTHTHTHTHACTHSTSLEISRGFTPSVGVSDWAFSSGWWAQRWTVLHPTCTHLSQHWQGRSSQEALDAHCENGMPSTLVNLVVTPVCIHPP